MTLKWLGSRTLLLRATVARAATPEDDIKLKHSQDASVSTKDEPTNHDNKHDNQKVYLTLGERRPGTFGRAFNFPVDVDVHDGVSAKLAAGVLRLTLTKLPEGAKFEK